MSSTLKKFAHRCWLLLAMLLLLGALVLSGMRGLLAVASYYKDDVAAYLGQSINAEVELETLSAQLQEFRPLLVVEGVKVTLSGGLANQFQTQRVLLDFDWWESLGQQRLIFKDIILDGFSTELSFDPFSSGATGSSFLDKQQSLANLFLEQLTNVTLTNSQVGISLPRGEHMLHIERLSWRNQGDVHQGDGFAYFLRQEHGGELHFRIDLEGDADQLEQMQGQVYAEIKELNLQALSTFQQQLNLGLTLSSQLNLELWGEFGPDTTSSIVASWKPSQVQWQQQGRNYRLDIEKGNVGLRQQAQGWQIDKYPWRLSLDQQALEDFTLQAWLTKQDFYLDLGDFDFARWVPLVSLYQPDIDPKWLDQVQSGYLDSAHLHFGREAGDLRYSLSLSELSTRGAAYLPKLERLALRLQGNQQQASLRVLQQAGELAIPAQFAQAWQLKRLAAQVEIDFAEQGLEARCDAFHLSTSELDLAGQWRLSWQDGSPWPFLSLMSNVDVHDAGKAYLYYPKVMPKKVFQYLKPALQAGHAQHSQVLWYGQLNHFPYANYDGVFQAAVPLRQASFQFDPRWPALEHLQLGLLFENAGLRMDSRSAMLGDVPAQQISASIPKFQKHSDLFIQGKVAGAVGAVVDYLQQSPIQALASSLDQLRLQQGTVAGEVNLHIPLYKAPVSSQGHVDFKGNHLQIVPLNMQLEHVQGRLAFHDGQLSSNGLSAQWRKLPLEMKLSTALQEQAYQIFLDLGAQWPITGVEQALAQDFAKHIEGDLSWQAALQVDLLSTGGFNYQADIGSELLGLDLHLPPPLSKPAKVAWPTVFNLSGNQQQGNFSFDSVQHLFARGLYKLPEQQGVAIDSLYLHLGEGNAGSWQRPGLGIELDVAKLDLNAWWDFYHQLRTTTGTESPPLNFGLALPPLRFIRAEVGQGLVHGQALDNLNFAYLPLANTQWQLESEQLIASVADPRRKDPEAAVKVVIEKAELGDLDFLQLDAEPRDDVSPDLSDEQMRKIREGFPSLALSCQACQLGRFYLGDVDIDLPMQDQQLTDGSLRMYWGHSQLNAKLRWQAQQQQELSEFKGVLSSDAIGQLIAHTGNPSPVEGAPTQIDFNLNWQGLLYHPDVPSLSGEFSLRAGEGVITEVSDQGSRLFTFASLDTIRRRLQLNFSDVFEKGLHFDEITASTTLSNGVVNNEDFFMDGVAGNMRGEGQVDLDSGEVDYVVSYSPKLTSSLPVLTAFLVTPATGVAVFALTKIFEPVVEVITQIDFALTGNIHQFELIELKRVKGNIDVPEAFRAIGDSPQSTSKEGL